MQHMFNTLRKFECPSILDDPTVIKISEKTGKSKGQILLRYLVQIGVVPIPNTSSPSRLKENLEARRKTNHLLMDIICSVSWDYDSVQIQNRYLTLLWMRRIWCNCEPWTGARLEEASEWPFFRGKLSTRISVDCSLFTLV